MDKSESQSWITDVYSEFWTKADELAKKEKGDITERRDNHLNAMVAMFISMMGAPVPESDEDDDDCEEHDCEECENLPICQERWAKEGGKQN